MSSIDTRLRRLEEKKSVRIILEMTIDGEAHRMTAPEFVAGGYDFLKAKIISGNSLRDAELILSMFPSCIT